VSLRHPPGADLRELPPEILETIIENHLEDFGYPMRCRSCPLGGEGTDMVVQGGKHTSACASSVRA
jgi:hypothetical protein